MATYDINKLSFKNNTYNLTPSHLSTGNGYGTATIQNEVWVVNLPGFYPAEGGIVSIYFPSAIYQYSLININNTGNKEIYYRNVLIETYAENAGYITPFSSGDCITMVYDGTRFHVISIDMNRTIKNYYEAGDRIDVYKLWLPCLLTNGRKDLRFSVSVDKPIVNTSNASQFPNATPAVAVQENEGGWGYPFYLLGYPSTVLQQTSADMAMLGNIIHAQYDFNQKYILCWLQMTDDVWTGTSSYNNREWMVGIEQAHFTLLGSLPDE